MFLGILLGWAGRLTASSAALYGGEVIEGRNSQFAVGEPIGFAGREMV